MYPAFGKLGHKVTVTGEVLDPATGLTIGTQTIVPDSVSALRLVFTVPEGAQSGVMALVSPQATVYSQSEFEVFYPPTLTGVDRSGAYPGETVILTGKHLGSDKAVFKLGMHPLNVLSRHRSSATVVLPKGARSGRFSVSCRGKTHVLQSTFKVYKKKASGS